jgi:predicted nucleotidyltransferase component of viral defense system
MTDFNLFLEKIRTLVIIALFSDDYLLNKLVLKGGNALNIIYKLNERSSIDIDVSIEDDFDGIELEKIKDIIFKSLSETFIRENLIVYDYTFEARPALLDEEYKNFWGGYRVEYI